MPPHPRCGGAFIARLRIGVRSPQRNRECRGVKTSQIDHCNWLNPFVLGSLIGAVAWLSQTGTSAPLYRRQATSPGSLVLPHPFCRNFRL